MSSIAVADIVHMFNSLEAGGKMAIPAVSSRMVWFPRMWWTRTFSGNRTVHPVQHTRGHTATVTWQ